MEHWLFCWEVQFRAKQASEHKNENKNENRRVPTSAFTRLFSENRQLKKAVLVFTRKNTLRASALQNEAQKQMALICTKMSYLWGLNFKTFSKIKKVCLGASQHWLILSFFTGCFHSCKKSQNIFLNAVQTPKFSVELIEIEWLGQGPFQFINRATALLTVTRTALYIGRWKSQNFLKSNRKRAFFSRFLHHWE